MDKLLERLTDDLGWAERNEIEFAQVAASDLRDAIAMLSAVPGNGEDVVERVARAIWERRFSGHGQWDEMAEPHQEPYRQDAKAAIAAMTQQE